MTLLIPKVEPVYPLPKLPYFQALWKSVEILVEQVIYKLHENYGELSHLKIEENLPIVTWFDLHELPGLLPIILINKSHSRFSNGTGRYFVDMINRFALPGHYLSIESSMTVDFYFADMPEKKYGLSHIGLMVNTPEEMAALQKNLPKVAEEIRITVQAVYEARRIVSFKQLQESEKLLLMQEKLTSIWQRDSKGFTLNLFDQVQQWLTKAQAENKSAQLWAEILPHLEKESKISFDRDMFLEIQTLLFDYREDFLAKKNLSDLARLICYQYFFKKKLHYDLDKEPFKRHVYIKLFKIADYPLHASTLGISVGVNLLNRYELLDANHILAAIQTFVPALRLVPHSYFVDARHEMMRFYYLEVHKEQETEIIHEEFAFLKTKLATELVDRIEIVNHPLFLPSNEEELLKYIAILSKELNKDDMPQVVISFDKQSQDVFSFHLVILRRVECDSPPLRKLLEKACPTYRWIEEQVKRIKSTKMQYFKEACIIKAVLPKLSFFRKDFSLDLGKARAALSAIVLQAIGEFRDYNGGTVEVQQHALAAFKEGFAESEELLLERFFYGIEPAFMQMILPPSLLQEGYALFKDVIRKEFTAFPFAMQHAFTSQGVVMAIASPFLKSTDALFQELFSLNHNFPSIAFCSLWIGRIFGFVLFYSMPDALKQKECFAEIERILSEKDEYSFK
ncbi:MAG TPA: hypothetical protein VGJ00_06175 [Rhabdochlamydiaceae bacterium]|jgi:hypothetical protein